jgi:very-short-patch-repair endonuclease
VLIQGGKSRESELPDVPPGRGSQVVDGRRCISVIGINQYRRWQRLDNAVSDARGVLAAFENLGFESVAEPLLDEAATGEAIRCLPSVLTPVLDGNDSLVVFFAGHGHTLTARLSDDLDIMKGYLIPVDADADRRDGRDHTWQSIEDWLSRLARLPPRHVLVILDSCHSGFALSRATQYRGVGVRTNGSAIPFHQRRSRRVLVSALDDQPAMDSGPTAGHSMFTGFLIEALRGGVPSWRQDSSMVDVATIANYVIGRVRGHSGLSQVPNLGFLEYDDCGELFLSPCQPRAAVRPEPASARGTRPARPHRTRRPGTAPDRHPPRAPPDPRSTAPLPGEAIAASQPRGREAAELPDRTEGWTLDPVLAAALDRHGAERRRGAHVLTIVSGDAQSAQTSWGTWAAQHGHLTLATQAVGLDAAVADLLAQTPWLRCVPEARKRLAAAAQIDVQAVDALLDARSMPERRMWVDDLAGHDPHARVSGWLLSWLRCSTASVPDVTTAPVGLGALLAIACDLASPTAVLLFHPAPDQPWFERAVVTATELIDYLPAHSVAVTAPDELVSHALGTPRRGTAWTFARQGLVKVEALAQRLPGRAHHSTMRVLSEALARDPRTRGRFELAGRIAAPDGSAIDVALVAHADRIAVELDTWYHFHDPEGYRRDRVQDARLARAGYFVLRFPAEDVDDRIASTIEQLAIALAGRRAARALL